MDHYSYSKLDTYDGCPLRFKRKYIEKRPEPPSEALDRGIAVHEVIAEYVKHCLATGVQTDLDFLRSVQGTDEVMEILETYANSHLLEPGKYEIEEMWKIPLGPFTFWGKVDLLQDCGWDVAIIDAKTDWQLRSQTDIDKDQQLRTYAWMASIKYPEAQEFHCAIDFVRHGVIRDTTYTIDDIPAIEKSILAKVEEIEADKKFQARPGPSCSYCAFTADCRAVTAGNIETVSDLEEAEMAAAQLLAIKARAKALEDLLKPWCSENGAVETNGMETGFFKSESYEYPDTAALKAVLTSLGFDSDEYFKPDTTNLKKAAKKSQALEEALDTIAIDKSTTRFTSRKVKS